MPGREHEELERELRELAPRIHYPPTPDVSRTVRRRLEAETAQRRRAPGAFWKLGWIAAAAAIVLLSLAVLSPGIRSTVSGSASSGAGGSAGGAGSEEAAAPDDIAAQYATQTTTRSEDSAASGGASDGVPDEAAAGGSAGASAAKSGTPPPGAGLGLGERIPSSEARDRAGKLLLLPEAPELVGEPAVFYARGPSEADGVVVVFGAGRGLPPLDGTDVGLLLAEVPGDLESAYPLSAGASGPPAEAVGVGGRRGFWLPDGRLLRSQPADGLPGGALLWEQEDTTMLMRANVTKKEAVRIAETIR